MYNLHMLGDLFSSVVIVIGGIVLIYTGWNWLDPVLNTLSHKWLETPNKASGSRW